MRIRALPRKGAIRAIVSFAAIIGAITGMTAGGFPAASAGSLDVSDEGGVRYVFQDCEKPKVPVLATDKRASGRITRIARNRAVTQYNEYVEAANAYVQCLSREAQQDLDAYYKAVTQAQKAEQEAVMGRVETMREGLTDER